MINRKDIDAKFVREIERSFDDIEQIKNQLSILNQNDDTIEKNVNAVIDTMTKSITKTVNDIANALNTLIDKDEKDTDKIDAEFNKLLKLVGIKEKEYKDLFDQVDKKLSRFMNEIENIEGYYKREGGRLKGVKLPEDRIFNEKFRTETVTEIIREQPIINEVEKKVVPILTKSMLEHYYSYGVKLSEDVMSPKYIQGYEKLQVDKDAESFFKTDKRIVLFRFIRTLLIMFLDDGTTEVTNVVKGVSIYKGNIIKDIRDQLSLDISPMEITAIQPSGQGFFIATLRNGVLFYNVVEKTVSSRVLEDNVIHIEVDEDKMLTISDTISIYNKEDTRIYSNRMFLNKGLTPLKVEKLTDGRILILFGGEKKGLAGLIYLYQFENGELNQKFIYTDPFDRRDVYFYDIISNGNKVSIIGNKDGNGVSYVYDVDRIDERYQVVVMDKEDGMKYICHNNTSEDYLIAFNDKIVLNNKVVYGLSYATNRDIVFRDEYAYCIYPDRVDRINVIPEPSNIFRFPVGIYGDGQDTKIVIKLENQGNPTVRVGNRMLDTYPLSNYIYIDGAVAGDVVEINTNGAVIDDIAIYSEYSVILEKKED